MPYSHPSRLAEDGEHLRMTAYMAACDCAAKYIPIRLIGKRLLGDGKHAVIGLLGTVLRQRLGLLGKIHGVEHGRVFLVAEIAAQPE